MGGGPTFARRCRMRFVTATERRVSYAELQQWPDDGHYYELYDGEVVMVPTPIFRHQRVAMHVADVLLEHEEAGAGVVAIAPLDVVFDQYNVLEPDVLFWSEERRHLLDQWTVAYVAPDLAVEVLSPSTQTRDRGRKKNILEQFGVPEYWIVDPKKNRLEIYVLRGTAYELAVNAGEAMVSCSPTLPRLTIHTDRIFAG